MTLNNESLVTRGCILLEPFQTTQLGPYLYDNAGARLCNQCDESQLTGR